MSKNLTDAPLCTFQHCYVTGGSTGLGLCLATLLVKTGAHVSIVARNQEKLDKAIVILEASRVLCNWFFISPL
jgi:short-subunit dehydrogenase